MKFVQAPEGAKVFTISLSVVDSPGGRSQPYLAQRSSEPSEEISPLPTGIAEAYTGKECSAFELGQLPNGTRYIVVLNEDKTVKFLNRSEPNMLYARVYRLGPGTEAKPEIVREGFQAPGGDVTVPVEFDLPGIGATKLKKLRTDIGYSFTGTQNGKPQVYTGRGSGLQVAGSQVLQQGKLTMTVAVPDEPKPTPDTQVALRFEPISPGLPDRTASGKISDFLTLGSTRFIVTTMAADFSQATLAVVAGSLEETVKEQLQVGAQMPAFSQVDLVLRKAVTREEVLEKANGGAAVVFVFGDFAGPRNPYGPTYPSGPGQFLPLPAPEIADQLGLELNPKPVVVFVTRQISIEFLYSDLRNKTPDYFVLTDFADPLRTQFRVPQSGPGGGWYSPPYMGMREPSLRQQFNLPERGISIAAFDSKGKVVYVKAEAAGDFLQSLGEARKACRAQQ